MIKFSIIIPVYNVEKYIDKCLNSVIRQTYKNYEVIIIYDKCTDNSEIIIEKYTNKYKKITKYYAENTGLARAKNIGIGHAKGEYILFLDGDDFIETELLQKLERETRDKPDIIRYQAREINDFITDFNEEGFQTTTGMEAFSKIIKYHYIENSWLYTYKTSFWKKNNFKFMNECIAEDYGLTPLIIVTAQSVKSIAYIGYNYVQRNNSIMNNKNYKLKLKKMNDMLIQSSFLKKQISKMENNEKVLSFINNSLIYYSTTLKKKDYKQYYKILKEQDCFNHINSNKNIKQKIKNIIIKVSPWFFYHYLAR